MSNIETADPRLFTPMIMNQDDNVVYDVHATRKTILREYTYDH